LFNIFIYKLINLAIIDQINNQEFVLVLDDLNHIKRDN